MRPVPAPEATGSFYRTLQRLQVVLLLAGRRAWTRMGPEFDSSWEAIVPGLVMVTSAAQLAAARAAVGYVPAVLAETGQPNEPLAAVRPRAFAGRASDGRSLPGLLYGAVGHSKAAAAGRTEVTDVEGGTITTRRPGLGIEESLAVGGRWLDGMLQTAVTDAARDATAAEVVVRERMGWVRSVNPPCCSRCAVLAGRWYSWRADFNRHPRCDCTAIPSLENRAGDFTTDSRLLVDRGLITDLSGPQRQRLAEGDDLSKVLNESRDRWRERMAADRRAAGPVDRLGRSRPIGWVGGGTAPPPAGATVHDLMARLTDRVEALSAMRAAGLAE